MIRILHILFITLMGTLAMGGPQWTLASDNTVLGTDAGANLTPDAHDNTLLGENAGNQITTGGSNTMVGDRAGFNTTTEGQNAFFGKDAGFSNTVGERNTYLGGFAGVLNQTGSRNVFVGFDAGANELGSFKLYIADTSTSAPLIYGEFDNALVGVNGALGVGTQIPMDQLHVYNGNLRIEQTGATHALLNFIANGNTWEIKNNQATGRLTFFSPGGGASTASFKFDRQAVENLLRVGVLGPSIVDVNGDLMVTGNITNPDYVFTPEYNLESIEAHSAYMWEHEHLPAVGPGQVNAQGQAMVNVATRSQGMLEELEKAHIYIEQLNKKMTEKETQLVQANRDIDHLKGEVATLKTLMQQLMLQNQGTTPGEGG